MDKDRTAFEILDEYFKGVDHCHNGAWQTLKAELAQQTNNSAMLQFLERVVNYLDTGSEIWSTSPIHDAARELLQKLQH